MPNDTTQPSTLDLAAVFVRETSKLKDDLEAERRKSAALARELAAAEKARTEAEAARDAAQAAPKNHPTGEALCRTLGELSAMRTERDEWKRLAEAAAAKIAAMTTVHR